MNRKQKMIRKMWVNYKCLIEIQGIKLKTYYVDFRNTYMKEPYIFVYAMKNKYKNMRIIFECKNRK